VRKVSETISEAKRRIQEADIESMAPIKGGYRVEECRSDYGDAEQRWLVVYSEEAEERARENVENQVQREHEKNAKAFSGLTERVFSCREDAEKALKAFESDLKASEFADKQVQRAPHFTLEESSSPGGEENQFEETGEKWLVNGTLVPSEARKARLLKKKSLFILATNELDKETLPAKELLRGYKGQVRVERGFRFLKEPWFMASSIYLQDEKRIMALLMVMTLCLLVYSALEWRIRKGLQAEGLAFPDQKGNPTQRPTARWVFQAFHGIHLLFDGSREIVLNMEERHNRIVTVLGHRYEKLYASRPP